MTTPAEQRADYVRALRDEREKYVRLGLKDRVVGVDAEIARAEGRPKGRRAPKQELT